MNTAENNIYQIAEMREKYQIENGEFTRLCNAIIEDICKAGLNGAQSAIVLSVIRKTYGFNRRSDRIAASQIASFTGLHKVVVSRNLKVLFARKILIREGGQRGEIRYNKYSDSWLEFNRNDNLNEFNRNDNLKARDKPKSASEINQNVTTKEKKEIYTSPKGEVGHLASQDGPGTPAKSIPFQKVVDLYHELLPNCPKVQKLNEKRKGYIRQRFIQNDLPDLNTWREYFNYCAKSPFLMGKSNGTNGRPPFIANLEWITNPSHFTDIWEGKYHRS